MGIVIRQSIKGTIVTYVGAFIGFLNTLFIATRFLQAEEIGLTRILIEAATFISCLAQLGVSNSGFRYFPYFRTENGKHKGFFFYMLMLPLVGILFFFTIYFVFKQPISAYFDTNSPLFSQYYFWVFPLSVFLIYMAVFETYSNVLMRIVVPRFMREIGLRLLTIGAILLYAFDVLNLNGFVVATIFAYGITALVDLFYISRIGKLSLQHDLKKDIPRPLRKDITTYSLFFILALIGNLLSMKLDIFMVSAKMGLAYTGIYSVAYFMAAIIEMPSRSISTISLPLVSEAFKNKDYDRASYYYKRVSLNQFLAGCTIFVFLWINMDNIYQIMPNGDVYIQGMYVVLFISMAKLLDMMANFGGSILNVSKYYRYSVPFVLLLAVLTVVSNNIFIPIFGISGAALATLISVGIYNSLIVTFIAWKMKIHPFTWSLLKVVILMGILLGLNQCISPLENPVEDAFLRSSLLGIVAVGAIYGMKISEEVNSLVDTYLRKFNILKK